MEEPPPPAEEGPDPLDEGFFEQQYEYFSRDEHPDPENPATVTKPRGRPRAASRDHFIEVRAAVPGQKPADRADVQCTYCRKVYKKAKAEHLDAHVSTGCPNFPAEVRQQFLKASADNVAPLPPPSTGNKQTALL